MTETSARPENLNNYVTRVRAERSTLAGQISAAETTFDAFANANPFPVGAGNIFTSVLPSLLSGIQDTSTFVEVVHTTLLDADQHDGVVSMTNAEFNAAVASTARDHGIDYDAIRTAEPPVEVEPPMVGAVPESSGYVDDPVNTATGQFLEDQLDFLMPPRVQSLSWPRRYASRLLSHNALGRGWFTWADVAVRATATGWELVTDEGRHADLGELSVDERIAIFSDAAEVSRTEAGWLVEWAIDSSYGLETWTFDSEGLLVRTDGWRGGTTTFRRDESRLVEMFHESGRTLSIGWTDERIGSVTSDDGRVVRYHYSPAGDLHRVESPSGGHVFETDGRGRIVEVIDADGVVVCINWYDAEGRVLRQANPGRRISIFEYLPGRVTRVLDADSNLVARYEHDEAGRLTRFVTPEGTRLDRTFGPRGETTGLRAHDGSAFVAHGQAGPGGSWQIDHADGRTERFTYDALGRVETWRLHDGPVSRFSYDGRSEQPSAVVTDGLGRTEAAFDPSGLLTARTDADGIVTHYQVDLDGTVRSTTDGAGRTLLVEPHPTGLPARVVDAAGVTTEIDCDAAGRITGVSRNGVCEVTLAYTAAGRLLRITDAADHAVSFAYDDQGFATTVTDQNDEVLQLTRDTWGRPASITLPDGETWRLDHTRLGELMGVESPSGARWTGLFDDQHRPVGTTDPCGRTASVHLDELGRVMQSDGGTERAQVFDDHGRVVRSRVGSAWISYTWDPFGRLSGSTDGDGVTQTFTWSPAGRATSTANGADTTRYEYDERGAIVAADGPTGRWEYRYDDAGRLAGAVSPEGRRARYVWDDVGRVVAQHEPAGTREVRYDVVGHVVEETVDGRSTSLAYDPVGRLSSVTAPGGTRTEFTYDANGRLTARMDPLGGQTLSTWDRDGRLSSRSDQLGRSTRFTHDAAGLLTSVVDDDGRELRYRYDDRGDLRAVADGDVDLVEFTHTADGILAAVAEPGHDRTVEFATTPGGRLAGWRSGDGEVAITYSDGRVTGRSGGGLPEARWTYEPQAIVGEIDGRPAEIRSDRDSSTKHVRWGDSTLDIDRDPSGRVQTVRDHRNRQIRVERDQHGRTSAITNHQGTTSYTYDDAGRLTGAASDDHHSSWTYDAAGRLIAECGPGGNREYVYDAAHQLVEVRVDGEEHTTFSYDASGRRTQERSPQRTRQFRWDAMSRLVAVIDDGVTTEVDIDGLGLLRRVGDSEVAWDLSARNPIPAAVNGEAVLTLGRRVLAVGDEIIPSALLGTTGTDPWGHALDRPEVQADVGLPGGLGFCGLVWLGARIYDPSTRQFLTPDPVGGLPTDNAHAHPYAYVDHDPLNRWDPTGLSGQPISIDDFNAARQQATQGAWKGIAIAVAATVLIVGASVVLGPVGTVLASAVIGGLASGGTTLAYGGSWSDAARSAAVGAVVGAAGGAWAAPFGGASAGARIAAASARPLTTRIAVEGTAATVQGFGGEGLNALVTGQDYNWTSAVTNTALTGAGTAVSAHLPTRSTPGAVDIPTTLAPTGTHPSGLLLPGAPTPPTPVTGPASFHGQTYVPSTSGNLLVPANSAAAAPIPRAPLTGSTSFGGQTFQPSSSGLWIPAP